MARVQSPALASSARWFDLKGVCDVLVMASPQVKANLSSEDVDVPALIGALATWQIGCERVRFEQRDLPAARV